MNLIYNRICLVCHVCQRCGANIQVVIEISLSRVEIQGRFLSMFISISLFCFVCLINSNQLDNTEWNIGNCDVQLSFCDCAANNPIGDKAPDAGSQPGTAPRTLALGERRAPTNVYRMTNAPAEPSIDFLLLIFRRRIQNHKRDGRTTLLFFKLTTHNL